MAFPHAPGLLPAEVAFLCEMELVTIIPRQRLERLDLLGGPTASLRPPQRANLPLWLAILLKRQRRANIMPPPWLYKESLSEILELETVHFKKEFAPAPSLPQVKEVDANGKLFTSSAPFVESCTAAAPASALPYHWYEMAEMILDAAADDVTDPDQVRQLLRDVREVRLAKMRHVVQRLNGEEVGGEDGLEGGRDGERERAVGLNGEGKDVSLNGIGAMEVSENRGFISGVMDGLRKVGASREQARREREDEERQNGQYDDEDDEEDDDMT